MWVDKTWIIGWLWFGIVYRLCTFYYTFSLAGEAFKFNRNFVLKKLALQDECLAKFKGML